MFEKIKNYRIEKVGKQSLFLALAFVMCVLIGGFAIYSIIFVGSSLDKSLDVQPPSVSPTKFDIQAFENLKLIR